MKKFPLINGTIRPRNEDRLGKNLSLFFEDGTKAYWGDFSKQDLKKLKGFGTLYVLSEYASFWNVPQEMILETADAFATNPARFGLAIKEKVKLKPEYIREKKIATIKNGIWIQNDAEWHRNYCPLTK